MSTSPAFVFAPFPYGVDQFNAPIEWATPPTPYQAATWRPLDASNPGIAFRFCQLWLLCVRFQRMDLWNRMLVRHARAGAWREVSP
jgi:hypothetical protein